MQRRWLRRSGIVALLVLVVLLLKFTVFAPEAIPVEVVTAAPGRVEETVTNTRAGTVKARRRAKLSPEVGGRVVAVPRRDGEPVARGEVLLRLDDRVQQARLKLAQEDFGAAAAKADEACLAARRAERESQRLEALAAQEIVSQDLLDEAATRAEAAAAGCEAARAAVERAAAALELARTELSQTVLRAPFDGVVAELSTEVGEWVTPSPPALPVPPVIDVLDPSSIYISAPMDEVDSANIRVGQPVRVTVDSHRGRHFPGRVIRVAPYVLDVEAQNRTVEIEVELDDPQFAAQLLPGTSADVEVILQVRQNVLRVPTRAILDGNHVLVVEDEHLAKRPVETGLRNWDYTEVMKGLEAGERVVVSLDRPEVKAGALVEVQSDDES